MRHLPKEVTMLLPLVMIEKVMLVVVMMMMMMMTAWRD